MRWTHSYNALMSETACRTALQERVTALEKELKAAETAEAAVRAELQETAAALRDQCAAARAAQGMVF